MNGSRTDVRFFTYGRRRGYSVPKRVRDSERVMNRNGRAPRRPQTKWIYQNTSAQFVYIGPAFDDGVWQDPRFEYAAYTDQTTSRSFYIYNYYGVCVLN